MTSPWLVGYLVSHPLARFTCVLTRWSSKAIAAPMCSLQPPTPQKDGLRQSNPWEYLYFFREGVKHCVGRLTAHGSSALSLWGRHLWVAASLTQWTCGSGLEGLERLGTGRCPYCHGHDLPPCFIIFLPYSDLLLTDPPSASCFCFP